MGRTDADSALSVAQQPQLLPLETFAGDSDAQPSFFSKMFITSVNFNPPMQVDQKENMLIFTVLPHSTGLVDIQPSGWGSPPFGEFEVKFGST